MRLIRLSYPTNSMAAVAFGHASSTVNGTGATSRTWAHDCTGDNYLVVSVNHRNDPGTSSATYNGTTVPLLETQNASFNFQTFYGLASPASGSNNIVATWTNSTNVGAGGISVNGYVSAGTVIKGLQGAGSGNYSTSSVTLTANDMLVGASGVPDQIGTISVVTGTERFEGGNGSVDATCSGATNTGVGSVLITWNYTSADPRTWIAIPLIGSGDTVTPDLRTYHYT